MVIVEDPSFQGPNIESATTLRTAIEILPETLLDRATLALAKLYLDLFPNPKLTSMIPVHRGAKVLERELRKILRIGSNPIRISHTDEHNQFMEYASVLPDPKLDITKIIKDGIVYPAVVVDPIAETWKTLSKAREHIIDEVKKFNRENGLNLPMPDIYFLTLVSKFGDSDPGVVNYFSMIDVHPGIWLFGRGPDIGGIQSTRRGRKMMGVKSPYYTQTINEPYFRLRFDPDTLRLLNESELHPFIQ